MTVINNMIEYAHQITLKWHLFIGFIMGAGPFSYMIDRWQESGFAVILGFSTAIGAGIGKMAIDKIHERFKKRKEEKQKEEEEAKK